MLNRKTDDAPDRGRANLSAIGPDQAGGWIEALGASRSARFSLALLYLATVLLFGVTVFLATRVIPTLGELDLVSGTWIALATDLVDGVFYRPMVDDVLGYGGTRYFPLHFALHAALIKAGLDPIAAGHVIGIASMLALIAGTYLLLRNLGVPALLAAPSAGLVLASASAQLAVLTIRGDSLPAALCVFGLAVCAAARPRIKLAALLFTLAIAAKVTAGYGVVAAVAALALAGRRRDALRLSVLTSAGITVLLVTMYAASEGRVFGVFRSCALGGGGPLAFLGGPLALVRKVVRFDTPGLPFLVLSASALIGTFLASWKESSSVAFLAAAGVLSVIFGSPGIDYNHLLDLHVLAVVVFVVAVSRGRLPVAFGTAALALAAVAACGYAGDQLRAYNAQAAQARWDDVRSALRRTGPLLCDDPLLPPLVGQHPYILDAMMIRVACTRDPGITERLLRQVRAEEFGTIALRRSTVRDAVFGPAFAETLNEHYELVTSPAGYCVYVRRHGDSRR